MAAISRRAETDSRSGIPAAMFYLFTKGITQEQEIELHRGILAAVPDSASTEHRRRRQMVFDVLCPSCAAAAAAAPEAKGKRKGEDVPVKTRAAKKPRK
jgi:hypothetical protein